MKTIFKLFILSSFILMLGCKKPDVLVPTTGNQLGSVTLITLDGAKYNGVVPENTSEPIEIEMEADSKTDLTKVTMYVEIPNNAHVEPGLGTFQDFTKPVTFSVIGSDGKTNTYTVVAKLIPTNLYITELWKKTATQLDFVAHTNNGVAISGDYVVVHSRTKFDYYKLSNGEKAGTMSWAGADLAPFPLNITSDDAGNIVSANFTAGAGTEFRMYWWKSVAAEPVLLFKWTSDAAGNVGRKLYVKGDMNKLAYIYAPVAGQGLFLRWEVKDGKVTSATPDKITFTHPNGTWGFQGKVVPIELGKNSNYFINTNAVLRITYMNGETNMPLYNSPVLPGLGHSNGFDYVDMKGAKYLFETEQSEERWIRSILKVRALIKNPSAITDVNNLIHTRNQNDWTKLAVDPNFPKNINATSDTRAMVAPDGKSATVAFISTNSGVIVWKVSIE